MFDAKKLQSHCSYCPPSKWFLCLVYDTQKKGGGTEGMAGERVEVHSRSRLKLPSFYDSQRSLAPSKSTVHVQQRFLLWRAFENAASPLSVAHCTVLRQCISRTLCQYTSISPPFLLYSSVITNPGLERIDALECEIPDISVAKFNQSFKGVNT